VEGDPQGFARIRGALAIFREDAFQPTTRRRIVHTKKMNDVTAIVNGNSPRNRILANQRDR